MALGVDSFRQVGSGLIEREIKMNQEGDGLKKSGMSRLGDRIKGWFNGHDDTRHQQKVEGRIQVKQSFISLLEKTEGKEGARRALAAAGLPVDFGTNDRPLTNRKVKQILDKAQEFRMGAVKSNEKLLSQELKGLEGPEHRDLRNAISRAVKSDPRYGSEKLTKTDVQNLRAKAETDLKEARAGECRKRFPELSKLIENAPKNSPLKDIPLDPKTLISDLRKCQGLDDSVRYSLTTMAETDLELGRSAWNQKGIAFVQGQLEDQISTIEISQSLLVDKQEEHEAELGKLLQQREELTAQIKEMEVREGGPRDPDHPSEQELLRRLVDTRIDDLQERIDLAKAIHKDMGDQIDLIGSKLTYLNELRLTDPLSSRSVQHTKMVWTQAARSLVDNLIDRAEKGELTLTEEQMDKLVDIGLILDGDRIEAGEEYLNGTQNPDTLETIDAPGKQNKETHPVVLAKRNTLEGLKTKLEEAGIPKEEIDRMFSKESLRQAERDSLARMDTWLPFNRDMVIMRDGVQRTYRSEILPAQFIDRRLGVNTGNEVGGTTAGVTDSTDHARNLKVSRLYDSEGGLMTTMVGHGVLDMWDIEDPEVRRQSNERGAKEVLEVALSTNKRLQTELSRDDRDPNAPPPRLVHVSVNLISPDNLRDFLGVNAYQEKTYTFNQFQAFEANSGEGRELQLYDPDHPEGNIDRTVRVDVDTITFSFGINAISTGAREKLMRVWDNVHEHNTQNMVKLVGDLGEGTFGSRGARPGGFIGDVYDRLEAFVANPDVSDQDKAKAQKMMGELRTQTDLVRGMFTEETFRTGNGDTAKMGREILVLQGLAEQGLDLVGAKDLGGTMSKGCKSDKDRGGVTDVEVKSKLIMQDMGGDMIPDQNLEGDDQELYYTVSSSSGQLENQRWNTGLAGSKEAGHLKARIPDPQVRQFLSGLGKFAKA